MTLEEIFETINTLKVGDKIQLNDFRRPFIVVGVSMHYVLAHTGQRYTIISKGPAEYTYNGVIAGSAYCGADWWVFGYADGYDFRSPQWVAEYMQSLETGDTEISAKHREMIWYLDIIEHTKKPFKRDFVTVKVDGNEIIQARDKSAKKAR